MTYHYPYGGSTAKRTMTCRGWRRLADHLIEEKKIPAQQPESSYAAEGTLLHLACETLIRNHDCDFNLMLPGGAFEIEYNGIKLTEEHLANKVIPAMREFEDLLDALDVGLTLSECTMEYSEMIGGTADALGISHDGEQLLVIDFKFGDGYMVDAKDNDQLMFCAWLAFVTQRECDTVNFVTLAIIQPSERRDSAVDVHTVSREEVEAWAVEFQLAVALAEAAEPGGHLKAGDHCKWCPSAPFCPEKTGQALAAQRIDVNNLPALPVGQTPAVPTEAVLQLCDALELADQLSDWIKQVYAFAEQQITLGAQIPGWKQVPKRGQRKWHDEAAAIKYFNRLLGKKNTFENKFKSPAKIEAYLKTIDAKVDLKKYTTTESSGTTLVRDTDKRQAVPSIAALGAALNAAR